MRFIFTFVIISLFSLTAHAQPPAGSNPLIGSIDGTVLDSISKEALEYAQVAVLKSLDSSVVASIYTGENGAFVLENLPAGKYIIKVSNSGYRSKFIPNIQLSALKPLRKLGNVSLVTIDKAIDEVTIQADKTALQIGLDKKVYNVGDDISVTGGSANDVLNNVPSVEIDQDGKVSLRGDGNVTILIDGKPSSLSGGNGKSLLDGIPAASIERIEIVTNPSAKYDPDGTSGIINVVLKKNIKRGLNGSISASAGTGNAYNGAVNLNMRNTKFNVYGNYAFDYKDGYRNQFMYLKQFYGDSTVYFDQERLGSDLNISHTAKIGMDIYLKDRNTLSWNVSGNLGDRERFGDQNNYRYANSNDTIGYWNRIATDPSGNKNLDAGLNYSWEFKEDKGTADFAAYQSFGQGYNDGIYEQRFTYPSDTSSLFQNLYSDENTNMTTLSMDVVRIFKEKWRTESGLKMIHRNMGVNAYSESADTSGVYSQDTLTYFDYSYKERIYSAYGIVARAVKNWKFQVGVRLEQSYQEPNLLSENKSFRNQYFNAFPSGHIRYKFDKKGEVSLGYSRRINRPNSDNLNPFTSYADPYNLRRGNPELRPEYIHSIDLSYDLPMKKLTLSVTAYQRYASSVINRVKVFYPDGTSAGTFANIDNSVNTGGEIVFQYRPLPIWRNMLSINGNYIKYNDNSNAGTNFNREGFVLGGKLSSTLELMKRTLTIQVNGRYGAPAVTPSGRMQPRGSMDFSIDKSLYNGKWGVGLRVSDIFNTQGFRFFVDQPGVNQNVEFKWETRRIYINVRYRFGKTDIVDKKRPSDQPQGGGGGMDF